MTRWGKGKHWLPSKDSDDEEQLAMEKELTAFARKYFSTDFPNPDRLGCPARGTLKRLVRASTLPDETLVTHLFGCSECFNEYQTALNRRQVEKAVAPPWWQPWGGRLSAALSFKPALAFASLVVLGTVSFWAWSSRSTGQAPIQAQSEQRPSQQLVLPQPSNNQSPLAAGPLPATSPSVPVARSYDKKLSPDNDRSLMLLAVDLNDYASVRSSDAPRQFLQLPRTALRLNLTLAEGSLAGSYTVALLNTSDQEVLRRTAQSRTGKQLLITLALQDLKLGSYHLTVGRAGEPARVYPVRVIENTNAKTHPRHPQ